MEHSFFDDFHSYSIEEQQEQINKALGVTEFKAPFSWISPEKIAVQPIYFNNPIQQKRSITTVPFAWKVTQRICIEGDLDYVLIQVNDALSSDVDCIHFFVNEQTNNFGELIEIIKNSAISFLFIFREIPSHKVLSQLHGLRNIESAVDFYGQYAQQANWKLSAEEMHERWFSFMESNVDAPLFINASLYANAGANIVQQIAFALSHLNAYLSLLEERAIAFPSSIHVQLSQGSNYFFELAKLTSFRSLAEMMIKEYSAMPELIITAEPLQRNKTTTDYNVNILRTTTEMMSAVLGGANRVMNHPYDLRFNPPNAFGDRIARNQLHILKHESYFDRLPNVMEGCYYVETLQHEMKDKAWSLFLEVEQNGGWLRALESNTLQSDIEQSRGEEDERFSKGELILVGTNKFASPSSLNATVKTVEDRVENKKDLFRPLETHYLS